MPTQLDSDVNFYKAPNSIDNFELIMFFLSNIWISSNDILVGLVKESWNRSLFVENFNYNVLIIILIYK